jgi:hypothetical protein
MGAGSWQLAGGEPSDELTRTKTEQIEEDLVYGWPKPLSTTPSALNTTPGTPRQQSKNRWGPIMEGLPCAMALKSAGKRNTHGWGRAGAGNCPHERSDTRGVVRGLCVVRRR